MNPIRSLLKHDSGNPVVSYPLNPKRGIHDTLDPNSTTGFKGLPGEWKVAILRDILAPKKDEEAARKSRVGRAPSASHLPSPAASILFHTINVAVRGHEGRDRTEKKADGNVRERRYINHRICLADLLHAIFSWMSPPRRMAGA